MLAELRILRILLITPKDYMRFYGDIDLDTKEPKTVMSGAMELPNIQEQPGVWYWELLQAVRENCKTIGNI